MEREREREEKIRERNLSLRSMEIGPTVFIGARSKVYLRVGTEIREFRQTLRGREFSYLGYF